MKINIANINNKGIQHNKEKQDSTFKTKNNPKR